MIFFAVLGKLETIAHQRLQIITAAFKDMGIPLATRTMGTPLATRTKTLQTKTLRYCQSFWSVAQKQQKILS